MPLTRSLAVVALFVGVVLGAIVVHDRVLPKPLLQARNDFTTFVCAGTVVRERGDPYHVEPLRACEHRLGEFDEPGRAPWEVVPSPFPGYVMALYALLSLPPFAVAHVLWTGVLLFGVGVTAVVLARLTGFALLPVVAIVAVTVGFWDLGLGEPTPVVAALLALGALCASRGAWRAAGVLVALAMIMPQVALPAFFALLLFAPRARGALLATAAALAVLSLATVGFAANVEYFTRTLPAQTAAEVFFAQQYSLTHLLALAGVPVPAAIVLGELSYAALVAVGIWAGRRLARASGEPACLVLVPAALATVGGAYAHPVQILTGVSAAILVASLRAVPARLAVAPLLLYAVLWGGDAGWKGLLVVTAASALAALWLASARVAPRRRVAFVAAAGVVLACAFAALHRLPAPVVDRSIASAPAPALVAGDQASDVWAYRNGLAPFMVRDARNEAEKVPLVAGVLLLIACALAAKPGREDVLAGGADRHTGVS